MYTQVRNLLLFCLAIPFLIGCRNRKQFELEQELRSITFTIPVDSMESLASVHLPQYYDNCEHPDYRYIVYYDSAICSTCTLNKMGMWQQIMKCTRKMGANMNFLFIFHPKAENVETFRQQFLRSRLQLKIVVDSVGLVEQLNPILKRYPAIRAFVLNSDNKIEVIGNATSSDVVEQRFYDFLERIGKQTN